MQNIDWEQIYMPRQHMNKLKSKLNKLLVELPILQKMRNQESTLRALRFEVKGARVDPDTKEILIVLQAKD